MVFKYLSHVVVEVNGGKVYNGCQAVDVVECFHLISIDLHHNQNVRSTTSSGCARKSGSLLEIWTWGKIIKENCAKRKCGNSINLTRYKSPKKLPNSSKRLLQNVNKNSAIWTLFGLRHFGCDTLVATFPLRHICYAGNIFMKVIDELSSSVLGELSA